MFHVKHFSKLVCTIALPNALRRSKLLRRGWKDIGKALERRWKRVRTGLDPCKTCETTGTIFAGYAQDFCQYAWYTIARQQAGRPSDSKERRMTMGQTRRQILAQRASTMRNSMTYAEKRLWLGFLRHYPTSFVAQKVIDPYIVDFFCRKARLSIELDGDTHASPRQARYDRIRTTYLEMLEIKELRFTNEQVYENFEGVCETIHNEVMARRNDVESPQSRLFRILQQKS